MFYRIIRRGRLMAKRSAILIGVGPAGLYVLAWLVVMPKWYRHCINPDGVSYISIAQKYLRGEFQDAINGYWGPLYSWLLMPFLGAGMDPLLAARILGGVLGLGVFAGLALLANHFGLSRAARGAVTLAAVPMTLFFSVYGVMPDLLLTVLLLVYLSLVLRLDHRRAGHGLWIGGVGGLAYLTKSYALPFFLVHLALMGVCQWRYAQDQSGRRRIVRNVLCAVLVFSLIGGAWIGLLTAKYGQLTWSTSGSYNLQQLAPTALPPHVGLRNPPNETAVSAWEDPSYCEVADWHPFQSLHDLTYYVERVLQNTAETVKVLLRFSALTGGIVLLFLLLLVDERGRRTRVDRTLYPLITLVLFCLGYALVVTENRYLWFCCLLLLVMAGYGYDWLMQATRFFTRAGRICILAGIVLSFAFAPLFDLMTFRNMGARPYEYAQVLSEYIRPGQRIASDGHWQDSVAIAYHLEARCHGVRELRGEIDEVRADLERYQIDHYLVWDRYDANGLRLEGFERVALGRSDMPALFVWKDPTTPALRDPIFLGIQLDGYPSGL